MQHGSLVTLSCKQLLYMQSLGGVTTGNLTVSLLFSDASLSIIFTIFSSSLLVTQLELKITPQKVSKGHSGSLAVRTGNSCPSSHLHPTHTPHSCNKASPELLISGELCLTRESVPPNHPMCRLDCASGTPAVPPPPSSPSSGPAARRWSCSGPG